jgi:SAM-dependent methyltransferase
MFQRLSAVATLSACCLLACDRSPSVSAAPVTFERGSDSETASHTSAMPVTARGDDPSALRTDKAEKKPDVVYVPTPQPVVDRMLDMAAVEPSDVVYDLGCGDGRIVVTAARRFGVKAHGFDVDPERIEEARANVRKHKVEHLVTIEKRDIFTLDLSPADVVTLYLLPELNVRLIPQLKKLRPGARIVSHDFDMRGVDPVKHVQLGPPRVQRSHDIYLWHAPIEAERTQRMPWHGPDGDRDSTAFASLVP